MDETLGEHEDSKARVIKLDDEQWERFVAALEAPAEPVPALVRLLADKDL
jgi:uncharacterized protein (DUF1778 family)